MNKYIIEKLYEFPYSHAWFFTAEYNNVLKRCGYPMVRKRAILKNCKNRVRGVKKNVNY